MKMLRNAVFLVVYWFSFLAAIKVRIVVPIGEPFKEIPLLPASTTGYMLILIAVVIVVTQKVNSTHEGQTTAAINLLHVFVISLIEYSILGIETESQSRLLLIYLLVSNLGASFLANYISSHLELKEDQLRRIWQHIGQKTNRINSILYSAYAELFVAFGLGIIWSNYILKMGLGVTSDSVEYFRIAMKFSTGGSFENFNWPPVYPLAISASQVLTDFPLDGAAIISAICLTLTLIIFSLLLRQYNKNILLNSGFILLLGTTPDFINLFLNAWSEQIFTLLLVGSCYLISQHYYRNNWWYFFGAAILAGIGMVTRHIGISMGAVLLLYSLFMAGRDESLSGRFWKYAFPLLIASAPIFFEVAKDTLQRGGSVSELGIAQLEQHQVFVYNIVNRPISATLTSFLSEFWKSAGHLYVFMFFFLLVIVIFRRLVKLETVEYRRWRLNLFLFVAYFSLALIAINFTDSYPIPRYWIPFLFLIFPIITHIWSTVFHKNMRLISRIPNSVLMVLLSITVLVALFSQLLNIENILFDRIRDAKGSPSAQTEAGFNLSSTAAQFEHFFEQISRACQSNTVILIDGDYNFTTEQFEIDNEVGKTFLFRSSIIASQHFTNFSFDNLQDLSRQELSYAFDGKESKLLLLVPDEANVFMTVSEYAKNLEDCSPYLVLNRTFVDEFLEQLPSYSMRNLDYLFEIIPYTIFSFSD